jgi:EpsI family protein
MLLPKLTNQSKKVFLYFLTFSHFTLPMVTFVIVYHDTMIKVAQRWFTFNDSSGLLILAITLYLVWKKKHLLKQLIQRPNILLGSGLTALGCFIFTSGKIGGMLILQEFSLIVTFIGLFWLLLGNHYLKTLLSPLIYLFFMFGLFHELFLFGNMTWYLQYVTAWIASVLLNLTGMPVLQSALIIELPHITLEVATACSGVNHIIALVAMAIPLGHLMQITWLRKVVLILCAFLIAIFANGLRVALIGIWAGYHKGGPLHGPFDLLYVSFIFSIGLGLLFFVSILMRRARASHLPSHGSRHISPVESLQNEMPMSLTSGLQSKSDSRFFPPSADLQHNAGRKIASLVIALAILSLTISYLNFYKPRPVYLKTPLTKFPYAIGDWNGHDLITLDKPFEYFLLDEEIRRTYCDSSWHTAELYIGYTTSEDQEKKLINRNFDWLHYQAEVVSIPIGGRDVIEIKKGIIPIKGNPRTFYFWYDINGRILLDLYRAKLAIVQDGFVKRRTNGAIVIILADQNQTQNTDQKKDDIKFIQAVFPIIRTHLSGI